MSSLFVIQGRDQGRRIELRERVLGVGRDPSSRIRLNDTEVSRRHAELHRQEDGYLWLDLGSSNGSFINSQRVDRQVLRSGDRVQVGRTLMIFTDSAEPAPAASREDVDIVGGNADLVSSQIVRAVRQDEGSQLLNTEGPEGQLSPWLARARRNLQIMYHTSLAVSHTLDIDQLLQRIMELIFEWVEADRGCIMLVDRQSDTWVPKVRRDRQRRDAVERMAISRTILDYVQSHQEGVLTSNAREDQRWESTASILKYGVREAICVPMQGRYGIVGAIYIDTFTPPGAVLQGGAHAARFSDEHLKLMVAIGHQAALAVEDTSYYSAMVQAERLAAMGQTIASLSHHIKNILQGIRGGSYLIQEGLKAQDWDVTRKGWSIVEKNQDRISALVLDMLTFSKEREPEWLPSDLNRVVGEVLELMASRAQELGVELVDQRQPDIPLMTFDPDGLHRAILNVVTNAIDAAASGEGRVLAEDESPEGDPSDSPDQNQADPPVEPPRVVVETAYVPDTSRLLIHVRDNGVGIPEDQQQRIFNAFVSSKGQRGTGLGLPVSRKILEEHGGQIRLVSLAGQGSCFTLELPAVLADVTGRVAAT